MDTGPYRSTDNLPDRVAKSEEKISSLEGENRRRAEQITGMIVEFREDKRMRMYSILRWLCAPVVIAAIGWSIGYIIDHASTSSARSHREEVADHERFCAAVGLHYAGLTPFKDEHSGWTVTTVVCGNLHGDGMYVGLDGHLHALKAHE